MKFPKDEYHNDEIRATAYWEIWREHHSTRKQRDDHIMNSWNVRANEMHSRRSRLSNAGFSLVRCQSVVNSNTWKTKKFLTRSITREIKRKDWEDVRRNAPRETIVPVCCHFQRRICSTATSDRSRWKNTWTTCCQQSRDAEYEQEIWHGGRHRSSSGCIMKLLAQRTWSHNDRTWWRLRDFQIGTRLGFIRKSPIRNWRCHAKDDWVRTMTRTWKLGQTVQYHEHGLTLEADDSQSLRSRTWDSSTQHSKQQLQDLLETTKQTTFCWTQMDRPRIEALWCEYATRSRTDLKSPTHAKTAQEETDAENAVTRRNWNSLIYFWSNSVGHYDNVTRNDRILVDGYSDTRIPTSRRYTTCGISHDVDVILNTQSRHFGKRRI